MVLRSARRRGNTAGFCLWAVCLSVGGVHKTHSFSQLCGSVGHHALNKGEFTSCLCYKLPCREAGLRERSARRLKGVCATLASATAQNTAAVAGGQPSYDGDPTRKRSWALKRAKGLQKAAERGVLPLKYIEIQCPGEQPGEEAEPLLILHGLLGSSRNFQGFAKALSAKLQRPRRIIIPDLRNHGDSPHARSMSYISMAMDVVALLDSLGIERSCIIGHSMGGKVAASVALYYSDRVESVGILDIAPVDYSKQSGPGSETWKDISGIITALHQVPPEALTDKKLVDAELAKSISDPVLRAFALTNLVRDPSTGGMRWKIGIANLKRNMGIIGGFDLGQGPQAPASELGLSFRRDAFFVQGGKSRFISSRHLPEISSMFPRFTLQTIRNAGHWVHSEDPETTVNNVQKFLDRQDPTPFN
mmetsp:Transcript_67282/g.109082  ORF Transcript_67282/g.109082 Transcript_67282/m.109082 type:complete len:419 (-) Transcript_67282:167-1423(-)